MAKQAAREAARRRRRQHRLRQGAVLLTVLMITLWPNLWSAALEDQLPERVQAAARLEEQVAAPQEGMETPAPTPTRAPTPTPAPTPVTITLSAAGDCTLGGNTTSSSGKAFDNMVEKQNGDLSYFLRSVAPIFRTDDLTIVNLETTLTEATKRSSSSGKTFFFRGKPEYTGILTSASVEVVTTANNHIDDFGKAGLRDTQANLQRAGIAHCGNGAVAIQTVKGVRVGFLGYTSWGVGRDQMKREVRALKDQCDLVVVSFHWGKELGYAANGTQISYGRAAVDAGADLVLGHHPHVVSGIERYEGKYIVYSLGNFCFGGNRNPKDKDSMIFQQRFTVTPEGIVDGGIEVIPCSISSVQNTNDYQPTPLTGERARRVLNKITKYSKAFPSQLEF